MTWVSDTTPPRSDGEVDLAELVRAWRELGNRHDAEELVEVLSPGLADLAGALGLLYAQEQAEQAVRAALQVANPRAASSMWRRKRRHIVPAQDWADAPVATLLALSTHALLDLAHVSPLNRVARRVPVAHHAVLRLQVADIIDADRAAEILGVPLAELEANVLADQDPDLGGGPRPRRPRPGR